MSWKSRLRKNNREKKEIKEGNISSFEEDNRSDLKQFMDEVNNIQKELDTLPRSHTTLIDSNSLTNFLLWKLLRGG